MKQFLKKAVLTGLLSTAPGILRAEQDSSTPIHPLPDVLMIIPFIILLVIIATGPLFYRHFWEKHYPKISIFLGAVTVLYYLLFLKESYILLHTLKEYISFMAILASLFTAAGGILIRVDRKATPAANVLLLAFGAVIANIIGTTGASMLLIRPFIRMNRDRIKPYHLVFFIFIVSNAGGALTPIGDPPLFLGFLRGVPFFWVLGSVWYIWIPVILLLLGIFWVFELLNKNEIASGTFKNKIEFQGSRNLLYLVIIIISVFLDPAVISWVPSLEPFPLGIREIIMFAAAVLAYRTADKKVLKRNEFDFEPVREVGYLFLGIFATMIPALQLISWEAGRLGDKLNVDTFYWATGFLSAILDNAPTYLNFLSAAMGKYGLNINVVGEVREFVVRYPVYVQAISVAAVFFGAMTYIGNGPNFMVKSISERAGIKMPGFFVFFAKYACTILLPVLTLVWLVFFYIKG